MSRHKRVCAALGNVDEREQLAASMGTTRAQATHNVHAVCKSHIEIMDMVALLALASLRRPVEVALYAASQNSSSTVRRKGRFGALGIVSPASPMSASERGIGVAVRASRSTRKTCVR